MSLQSFNDTLSGAFAGFCFRFVGHPFDTVKVRMQMNEQKLSFFKTAFEILKREGIFAYYKGMASPLLADIPSNAVLFGIYEYVLRLLETPQKDNKPHILQWLIAGGFAGIGYACVVCPAEMTKCVMQMQKDNNQKTFKSPLHCFKTVIKRDGIRSTFTGLTATIVRDIPQNAVFFATYEYSKYFFMSENKELPFYGALISGALGGLTCCLASYPLDVVKTSIQLEVTQKQENRKFKEIFCDGGIINCFRDIYRKHGLKGFWSGVDSCIVYYMVGCAASFTGYHYSSQFLTDIQKKY